MKIKENLWKPIQKPRKGDGVGPRVTQEAPTPSVFSPVIMENYGEYTMCSDLDFGVDYS